MPGRPIFAGRSRPGRQGTQRYAEIIGPDPPSSDPAVGAVLYGTDDAREGVARVRGEAQTAVQRALTREEGRMAEGLSDRGRLIYGPRSEERRVGKEWRSGGSQDD